jgi:hypothetical protein
MPSIQIIKKPHNNNDWVTHTYRYSFIKNCPKFVTILDSKLSIFIDEINFYKSVHKELASWVRKQTNTISLNLCVFFYNTIGFIPFIKLVDDEMYYDPQLDPSVSDISDISDIAGIFKNIKPVMVEFMGIQIPKALVKQMRLIQDNVEDVGNLFKFKIEEDYFPKDLRKHVKPALQVLVGDNTTTYVRYLYIYEMLGISLADLSFIIGDELFPLTVENLRSKGVFRDWYGGKCRIIKMPSFPVDRCGTLSDSDIEYITDSMIERFNLCSVKCIGPFGFPTPFETRIRTYNAHK